jgi:hypothetical protein
MIWLEADTGIALCILAEPFDPTRAACAGADA